ncbi:MAG: Ku protein [Cellvibrionaceae bacterium]|nr:Ku protein [Cellvibrionaceae bacterium]
MQDDEDEESGEIRPFWSGTVAFGLLSLPVNLFVASRRDTLALRMLDEDGTPLSRRYICSKDEEPLDSDELVRGIEIREDTFIEIEDDELEALAPEKSREINLRRFVPLKDIDALYFEKAYFLVPEEGAQKAYRLLATSMQDTDRAGIATFVMRGKEYLVAIISERGILRAETLRFHDEIRSPADIGLPSTTKAEKKDVDRLIHAIETLGSEKLDLEALADDAKEKLEALVEKKLEKNEDVKHPENLPQQETAQVIDLMQVLKRSLEQKAEAPASKPKAEHNEKAKKAGSSTKENKNTDNKKAGSKKASKTKQPQKKAAFDKNASKEDLYKLATQRKIPGRSQMSKTELIQALSQ